ncbi:hypothetical protein ABZW10_29840 [Kitasatospora sp. NPDC004723]
MRSTVEAAEHLREQVIEVGESNAQDLWIGSGRNAEAYLPD